MVQEGRRQWPKKGSGNCPRRVVVAAQEGRWWWPNKGNSSGGPIRAAEKKEEGRGDTFGLFGLLTGKEVEQWQ